MAKILVVDDEEDILELVRYHLMREGYQVECAETGEKALDMARSDAFDLMLLDLMLPGIDGLAIAKTLKNDKQTIDLPIIMLTAKGEESDIVAGLELGAEDYITKPFSPKVLMARVRTVLRRQAEKSQKDYSVIRIHDIVIDHRRRHVTTHGEPVELTYTEYQILYYLAKKPGWVFTRSQIIDAVRGDDYPVTARSVDVQIVGLRKKLGTCGEYIETVRGVGYRFRERQ